MKSKKAFTLVELLVVIAVIALLLSILIPALRLARDQAMRAACSSSIHQHLIAMTIFADEHEGRLPVQQGGWWLWDVSYYLSVEHLKNLGIDVSKYGLQPDEDVPTQDIFYCPANPMHRRYKDEAWHYLLNYDPAKGYWVINNKSGMYRVTGYLFLWWGPWSSQGIEYGEDEPAKEFLRRIDVKQPSKAELVLDVTMSDARPNVWPTADYPDGNFAQIMCGGMPGEGNPDSSSHVLTERKPAGGNIGFADGHVEWRPFNKMKRRFNPNSCPIFWW